MEDSYFKLKPLQPTPIEEICDCKEVKNIYLAHKLGPNPIHCLDCNGEIEPEKLYFTPQLIEDISTWNSVYGSLYMLWLNSGEYETFAKKHLLEPNSQVNVDGIKITKSLAINHNSYYLWFVESSLEDETHNCPLCGEDLIQKNDKFKACEKCKLLI